ncbi:MAG: PEGA domain-containing protein [Spirochaetales bacterium]|nr:PEGA domain-containing protein [Spirochaetales bacterium]
MEIKKISCMTILFLTVFTLAGLDTGGLPLGLMELEPIGVDKQTALTVEEMLRTEFVRNSLFTVVEKARLNELLREQNTQLSGMTESTEAVRVGQILNVKKLAFGSLAAAPGGYVKYIMTLRIVDVETASTEFAATVDIASDEAIRQAAESLVRQIAETISVIGEVRLIDGEDVYVTLGSAMGIAPEDILSVFEVNFVRDRSGLILFREEQITGALKVLDADDRGSRCEQIGTAGSPVREGMLVRRGTTDLSVLEEEPKGSIVLVSVPEGAKAYLNDELVGLTPVTVKDLEQGKYTVEMRLPGYKSYRGVVNLSRGRTITLDRDLEKMVEIEDMLEGQAFRKPTDPKEALRWSWIPGGGQYYNGYEITGITNGVGFLGLVGVSGIYLRQFLSDTAYLNEQSVPLAGYNSYYDFRDYYGSEQSQYYSVITSLASLLFASGTMGYAAYDSYVSAPESVRSMEYTELRFGGQGWIAACGQTPDTFDLPGRWMAGADTFNETVAEMLGFDTGFGFSVYLLSKRFDKQLGFYNSANTNRLELVTHLRFPLGSRGFFTAGLVYMSNMQDTSGVDIPAEEGDQVITYLRELFTPTLGVALQWPSFSLEMDIGPFALGVTDLFFQESLYDPPGYVETFRAEGVVGYYGRVSVSFYFNKRFGICLEGKYSHFYRMWDESLGDLGVSLLDHRDDVIIFLSPVFRF